MLTPEQLIAAYRRGCFPMASMQQQQSINWYNPSQRAIIPVGGVHCSHSLSRRWRQLQPTFSINRCFATIIDLCSNLRRETWINTNIRNCCIQLYQQGLAISIECWRGQKLIGGLYGITLAAAFCAESMFSLESNGSKFCMVWGDRQLQQAGYHFWDCQFITPHLSSMGAITIPQQDYQQQLATALAARVSPLAPSP